MLRLHSLAKHARVFLLVLASAFFSIVPRASAQDETPCSTETLQWVAKADAEHPAKIRALACPPGHIRLELGIEGSSRLEVDISHSKGRAFRQIGRLGVSPILEIDDYRKVPAPQREAFETLCSWITKHEAEIPAAKTVDIPAIRHITPKQSAFGVGNLWSSKSWWALVCVLLIIMVSSARKAKDSAEGRRDWFFLSALFVVSAFLRFAFGPFGPHHANGQGPMWIQAVSNDPTRLEGYGPGYAELFSNVAALFPRFPDESIFRCNAIFGAFAPPLVFALARKLGLDDRRALMAGALLAVDAVSIRFGATESYFPSIITLALVSYVLLVSAAERLRTNHFASGWVLTIVGGLVAAQTARIHPIAWGPAALGPAFVLAMQSPRTNLGTSRRSWAHRIAWTAAIGSAVALVIALTSGEVLAQVAAAVPKQYSARGPIDTIAQGLDEHVFVLLPLLIAFVLAKPRDVLIPALASVFALVVTRKTYGQSPIWLASYDRLWLTAPLLVLAAVLPQTLTRKRYAWGLIGAATIALLAAGWPTIRQRTTEQLEYTFFRNAFASFGPDCRVAHVPRIGKRIVALPDYAIHLTSNGSRPVVGVSSADDALRMQHGDGCVRYARTSICTSTEGRPVCEAIEAGLELTPLSEQDLPAYPSHFTSTYDRDVVHIGLFELRRH